MSVGHFCYDQSADLKPILERVLKDRRVHNYAWDRKFRIDHNYDIPYLTGYSEDGATVYVDHDLPLSVQIAGRTVHLIPLVVAHERVEKALMAVLGFKYPEAHELASYAEYERLTESQISPKLYEKVLSPYVKADQPAMIRSVPKDLDLASYRDSRDVRLLTLIKSKMKGVPCVDDQRRKVDAVRQG